MELKDLTIQLGDLNITNIRWKSRSIEISTDGGKSYRRPTYYETINLYTANLCDCDGSSSGGGSSVDVDELKKEIEEYILEKYPQIDVEALKTSITSDKDFKKEVASLVEVDNADVDTDAIATKVKTDIKSDSEFKSEVAALVETSEVDTDEIVSTVQTNLKADSEFKSEVAKSVDTESIATTVESNVKADDTFKKEVASLVEVSSDVDTETIETNVKNSLKSDDDFKSEIAKSVTVDTDTITSTVETNVKSDDTFKKEVAALVEVDSANVDTDTIETNVKLAIKTDDEFKSAVAALVDTTDIASTVETNVKADDTFKSDVAKLVEVDTDSIETNIKADETFKKSVAALVETSGSDVDTETIENNIKTSIKEDSEFKSEIATTVETNVKADEDFKKEVAALVEVSSEVDTDAIASIVETNVKEDETFKSEIVSTTETNIKADSDFKTAVAALVDTSDIETNIKEDSDFKSKISSTIETALKEDETFKTAVAESVDTDSIISTVETNIKSDSDFKAVVASLIDIDKSFLTETGFGNLRYYNNNFSYYNGSEWIDIVITDNNQFIINMTPANMPSFGTYIERDDKCISLIWEEPDDTIVDSQVLCYVEGIKIVRKLGSEPESVSDGDLILDLKRADFGKHDLVSTAYMDKTVDFTAGNTYYYKFFPYASNGLVTNSTLNCKSITITDYTLFGFVLDQTESNPANMITYIEENRDYKSAYMDFDADAFNYGSWENAWFIRKLKPCMLKLDGTVDYELDKDNYAKSIDGATSDVANDSYEGNVMVGIPKVYWKIVDNEDNTCNVYICDTKLDDDFHCWSHIDANGNEIDYCYMSAYEAHYNSDSNRLNSISGVSPRKSGTVTNDNTYARNNNVDSNTHIWEPALFNDRVLITLLLLLIGKSTNVQSIFGGGYSRGTSTSTLVQCGNCNGKGLFWGASAISNTSIKSVKVFGIENLWGNVAQNIAGLILNNGVYKVKMTYGTEDGSTVIGYNASGSGYVSLGNIAPAGTSGGFINKMLFSKYGLFPINASGSSSTYFPDTLTYSNTQVSYSCVGGSASNGTQNGIFNLTLTRLATASGSSTIGAGLSCKPLAPVSSSDSSEENTDSETENSATETTEEVSE